MEKRELDELYYLEREIRQQRKELEKFRRNGGASARAHRGHVHVNGLAGDAEIHALQWRKMENLIEKNIDEYLKKRYERMCLIRSIEDSEMRQIMRLRYLEHRTWQQIAVLLGVDGDGSTERKKHDRYLKQISRNSQTDPVKWSCRQGMAV